MAVSLNKAVRRVRNERGLLLSVHRHALSMPGGVSVLVRATSPLDLPLSFPSPPSGKTLVFLTLRERSSTFNGRETDYSRSNKFFSLSSFSLILFSLS